MVSKKIETSCCDPALRGLVIPSSIGSALDSMGGLRGLMRTIPSEARLSKDAGRHQSLADPTRLKILWALSEVDLCPCILKVIAGVPDSKLSYHLRILESARLIRAKRVGNWRIYSITAEGEGALARNEGEGP